MEYAIATVCLSGGLNEKLQAIAHAGFKCVEMFENDLLSFNGTPSDVRRMIEDLGLKTLALKLDRHSGMVRRTRPQMCDCTSGNLEILRCAIAHHSSMLRIAPEGRRDFVSACLLNLDVGGLD
jgi:hypothetical protein